jgi:peptidoglycan/xylan/chitin deacetylase (PgdA/CDA1 family)
MREGIAYLIRFSGLPWLAREWLGRRRISIIVYHDPSPQALSRHLAILTRKYHVIGLEEAVSAMASGTLASLTKKSLVLTIDDGHKGNYELLEIFKSYGVKPTIYCCSHLVGTHRQFWPTLAPDHLQRLKQQEHVDFLAFLKSHYGYMPDKEYPQRQFLSIAEMQALQPWADLQVHTRYHFCLPSCDRKTATAEIAQSRQALSNLLGSSRRHFSYPFGNYSKREVLLVRQAGYQSARTTIPGWNSARTDPLKLKIIAMVPDDASIHMLYAQLSGLPNLLAFWKSQLRGRGPVWRRPSSA